MFSLFFIEREKQKLIFQGRAKMMLSLLVSFPYENGTIKINWISETIESAKGFWKTDSKSNSKSSHSLAL